MTEGRTASTAPIEPERIDFNEAHAKIATFLIELLNAPHAEHFGPFCPVCGLVGRLQAVLRDD